MSPSVPWCPPLWQSRAEALCTSHSPPVIKDGALGEGGTLQRNLLASGQGADNENVRQGAQLCWVWDTLKASPVLWAVGRALGDSLTMSPQPSRQPGCHSLSITCFLSNHVPTRMPQEILGRGIKRTLETLSSQSSALKSALLPPAGPCLTLQGSRSTGDLCGVFQSQGCSDNLAGNQPSYPKALWKS